MQMVVNSSPFGEPQLQSLVVPNIQHLNWLIPADVEIQLQPYCRHNLGPIEHRHPRVGFPTHSAMKIVGKSARKPQLSMAAESSELIRMSWGGYSLVKSQPTSPRFSSAQECYTL